MGTICVYVWKCQIIFKNKSEIQKAWKVDRLGFLYGVTLSRELFSHLYLSAMNIDNI